MFHRPDYARIPWWWIGLSLVLSAIGILFVISATAESAGEGLVSREASAQMLWWLLGAIACTTAMHVAPATWRRWAFPIGLAGAVVMFGMLALADTPLAPRIKGKALWLVLGGMRLQPVEMAKLSLLLASAAFASGPNFDARRLSHCAWLLILVAIPSAIIAKEDMGSALTLPAMVIGILVVAGMRASHVALLVVGTLLVGAAGYALLPREGPSSYQWRRIQAFLHPDEYALAEAYQTERSKRSIGSGQWTGKGWMEGEQNRLGWVPEKHTDMVFAVIGEEVGFVGSATVILLLMAWCGAGLLAASRAPGAWGRLLATGFVCLVGGQAAINLAVVMGMMPVAGLTLPFVSYGGSSMVACWLGLGICASVVAAEREA